MGSPWTRQDGYAISATPAGLCALWLTTLVTKQMATAMRSHRPSRATTQLWWTGDLNSSGFGGRTFTSSSTDGRRPQRPPPQLEHPAARMSRTRLGLFGSGFDHGFDP